MDQKPPKDLNKEYTVSLTKQELIIIFNVLIANQYRVGDAVLLYPAIKKIEAIVAIDTNIQEDAQKPGIITQRKVRA